MHAEDATKNKVVIPKKGKQRVKRWFGGSLVAIFSAISLSGCFMIPALDHRSPFDDPFGPSFSSVEADFPKIEKALEGVDLQPYSFVLEVGKDNCEGPCNLGPSVRLFAQGSNLDLVDKDRVFPSDKLAELIVRIAPVMKQGEPLRIELAYRQGKFVRDDALFGADGSYGNVEVSPLDIYIPYDKLTAVATSAENYLQ